MLFALTDDTWKQVIEYAIGTVVTAVMLYMQQRNNKAIEAVAKTGKETHELVNGAMSSQLKLTSDALTKVASMTNKPMDVALAELAAKATQEHEARKVENNSGNVP